MVQATHATAATQVTAGAGNNSRTINLKKLRKICKRINILLILNNNETL